MDPRIDVRDRNGLPRVERPGLVPRDAPTQGKCSAVLAHHVLRIFRQFFHQEGHAPFRAAEGPPETRLQLVSNLALSHGVARQEHDLVADPRSANTISVVSFPMSSGVVSVAAVSRLPSALTSKFFKSTTPNSGSNR